MAMGEELEPLETKKSKKKDKINLKPEMDENMRTLKDFRNRIQEHCGECGAMDHVDEVLKGSYNPMRCKKIQKEKIAEKTILVE